MFLRKLSSLVENTGKKLSPSVQFVGIFVGIGMQRSIRPCPPSLLNNLQPN
jgi:hypothetical protein